MNRRAFVAKTAAATAAAAALGVVGYTLRVEPHWLEIVRRDLAIAHLPAELEGKTLAQVSDIHIGPDVDDEYLLHSFDRLRAIAPDIVVVTGDFLTHKTTRGDEQFAQLRNVVNRLPHGRLATVGILGNHDYGRGWAQPDVANRVVKEASEAGILVLRNQVYTVSGLDIIGVDDLWAYQADTKRALAERRSAAQIALCHNPDGLDLLPWGDYTGWVLAGHTHGGQCKPPFLPPPLLPVANRRYVAGEVVVNSERSLYISRGIGHLIRARFNVRPEITVFTLRAA